MRRPSLSSIGLAVLWTVGIAVGVSTVVDAGAWYQGLERPAWQPSQWLSDAIWSIILVMSAVAGVVTANHTLADRRVRHQLVGTYLANGILAVLWSWLFFHCHRPDWALAVLPLLWASVAGMIWVASRASRPAAWLLIPYLAWVTLTGALNLTMVTLNYQPS